MNLEWLLATATFLLAIVSPVLAWWGSNRYFTGRWEEQSVSTAQWRVTVEKRMDSIDQMLQTMSFSAVMLRLQRIEEDIERLRSWQESEGTAYIRATDVLNERVGALEGKRR